MQGNTRANAIGARKEHKIERKVEHKLERKAEKVAEKKDPVHRPTYTKGTLEQATGVTQVLSAWDRMLIAK